MHRPIHTANQGSGTITCTPHFKEDIDIDKSWVSADMGPTILSIYLHPKSDMTLEDAVKKIETFSSSHFTNSLNTSTATNVTEPILGNRSRIATASSQYTVTITSCVIRGDNIQRHEMSGHRVGNTLHDGESVSMPYYYNWLMNMQQSRRQHVNCVIL